MQRIDNGILDGAYQIQDTLSESKHTIITRAIRTKDGTPVILKQLQKNSITPHRFARFRREFQLTYRLSIEGVCEALAWHEEPIPTIVFRDTGGLSLRKLRPKGSPWPLDDFFPIAIQLCSALSRLHHHKILHKDLNTNNVVWNPSTKTLEIIDLGIASSPHTRFEQAPFAQEDSPARNSFRGTAAYISPEQTGRTDTKIDNRSDLYSLGVTLFELLTGRLPFPEPDRLSLIHAHLTQLPPSIQHYRPQCPPVLDKMIERLLAKRPEERYQSALGLQADLERVWREHQQGTHSALWTPGQHDLPPNLSLPDTLYGRYREQAKLSKAFGQILKGEPTWVMLAGPPGIGKSALAAELQQLANRHNAIYATGKFEQLAGGIGYKAIKQSLRHILKQIASEAKHQLNERRDQLLDQLGSGIGTLCSFESSLKMLVPQPPPAEELGGMEAEHRFHQLLAKLFALLSRPKRPIVLFLDDWQWADQASLRFLKHMLRDGGIPDLMLVGSYRNNEITPDHPMQQALESLLRAGQAPTTLLLRGLQEDDINNMLTHTLHQSPTKLQPLTSLLLEKTMGNPFFLRQFLHNMHRKELLVYQPQEGWTWDLTRIREQELTDNVIKLLSENVSSLPQATQLLLKLGSCLGSHFSLLQLTLLTQSNTDELYNALQPALHEGLIKRDTSATLTTYTTGSSDEHPQPSHQVFSFTHDRIQQSAYSLIPQNERPAIHLWIGQTLANNLSPTEQQACQFLIASQLTEGLSLLDSDRECVATAAFFLEVAQQYAEETAFLNAHKLLLHAQGLLTDAHWQSHRDLCFAIHLHAARYATRSGHFDDADRQYPLLLQHAQGLTEQNQIGATQTEQYLLQGRHQEGLAVTLQQLQALGLTLPNGPYATEQALQNEIDAIEQWLETHKIEEIAQLPDSQDTQHIYLVEFGYALFLNAFLLGKGSLAFYALAITTRTCLDKGNSALSGYIYVGYGLVLSSRQMAFQKAYRFGYTGLSIAERFGDKANCCKTNFIFAADLRSWTQPLRSTQPFYDRAYQLALECGDWTTLGYVIGQNASDRFTSGEPLNELLPSLLQHRELLQRLQNDEGLGLLEVASLRPILELTESKHHTIDPLDPFSTTNYLEHHATNPFYLAWWYAGQIRIAFLLGKEQQYPTLIDKVALVEENLPSHAKVPECCFFGALMAIELWQREKDTTKRKRFWDKIQSWHDKLAIFAHACPQNVQHKLELIKAEIERAKGHHGAAIEHYETAIAEAKRFGFSHIEAIALERYAQLWQHMGRTNFASELISSALLKLIQWGANNAAKRLRTQYASWLPTNEPPSQSNQSSSTHNATYATNTEHSQNNIDLSSVVKATHTISTRLDLNEATHSLLKLVQQSAGAQRCVVLWLDQETQQTTLTHLADHKQLRDLPSIPLESIDANDFLCVPIARYVLHSQNDLFLANATEHGEYTQHSYIKRYNPLSIMCIPMHNQGQLCGCIYFENGTQTGVFSKKHKQTTQYLANQLAMNMAHNLLFDDLSRYRDNLEQLVEERTISLNKTLDALQNTQQELLHSARLAGLGNTVAGVAHELNTPLGIALTAEDFLSLEIEDLRHICETQLSTTPNNAEIDDIFGRVNEAAELIRNNLRRAADLVRSFKQVAVDSTSSQMRYISLRTYLNEILTSLSPLSKQHKLIVHFIEVNNDPLYYCDPGLLAQLMTNLLENAGIHAYEGNGGPVQMSLNTRNDGSIVLRVIDRGVGMSTEVAEAAFDPFFTTNRSAGGSGLGLHVVYSIVTEGLKGQLELRSTPGQGTEFRILLPPSSTPSLEMPAAPAT